MSSASSGLARVFRNTAVGAGGQLIAAAIGIVTTPLVLDSIGSRLFGTVAVATSLFTYIGVLDFGIGAGLARFMSHYTERGEADRAEQVTAFGFLFYLLFAVIILPLAWIGSEPVASFLRLSSDASLPAAQLILLVVVFFCISMASGVLSSRLIAAHRADLTAIVNLIGYIGYAVLVAVLVTRERTVAALFTATGTQIVLTVLLLTWCCRQQRLRLWPERFRPGSLDWRALFGFGFWTQVNSITAVINLEADKAIISRYVGVAQVTPYQVANRLALFTRTLPMQAITALLPALTARYVQAGTLDKLSGEYRRSLRAMITANLFLAGFLVSDYRLILQTWLGRNFGAADLLIVAITLSYFINNCTGVGTVLMRVAGRPRYETYYAVASAVLNVAITMMLLPTMGLYGVVIGTIVGNVVGSVYFIVIFHRLSGLGWWDTTGRWLTPLCLVTGIAGGAIWLLPAPSGDRWISLLWLGAHGTGYVATFAVAGWLLGYWNSDDRAMLQRPLAMLRKRRAVTGHHA